MAMKRNSFSPVSLSCFLPRIFIITLSLLCHHNAEKAEYITIGGIFDQDNHDLANHFSLAVDRVNKDLGMLSTIKFQAKVHTIQPKDSLTASKYICDLARNKVAAFVGPVTPSVKELVKSAAHQFNIPHISTNLETYERRSPYTLTLYPDIEALGRAYRDIIEDKKWKKFAVIYDNDDALIMLKSVLAFGFNNSQADILLYEFDEQLSYAKMLKDIASKNHYNIIVGLQPHRIRELMRVTKEGYSSFYNAFLILGLDFHFEDLSDITMERYFANVTTLRLVDPQREEVEATQRHRLSVTYQGAPGLTSSLWAPVESTTEIDMSQLTTEQALMYDAVALIANGVNNLSRMNMIGFQKVYCHKMNSSWDHGQLLLDNLKEVTVRGLTGDVRIDRNGFRDSYTLDVLELNKSAEVWSFKKTVLWDPISGLKKPKGLPVEEEKHFSVEGLTLRVVTVPNEPYTIVTNVSDGQDKYMGYAIDLIKRLAARANFTPEFYIAADGQYGRDLGDGTWDGMIGDLMSHKADIAIVDLTTTAEREEVVDFTTPFMMTGISILLRIPEFQPPSLFSFLHPFSIVVWFYTLTVFILVSVITYILGRFSPYEWVPSHPCDPNSEPENQFGTLNNCFWFTMGSIMQQGSDLVPRAVSTRTLASLWYFFCLILISSYTANLAAFLTAARMSSPIENANDLAKQTDIAYGAKAGGSTARFFQNSDNAVHKRMWAYMESTKPSVFPRTNPEGIQRVLKGDYAYLMEATSIEYAIERNCNLTQVGGLLDNKGYGIATPQGSPVRNVLEHHLIVMQEKGELQELKELWWKTESVCQKGGAESAEMTMDSLGGVFVTLVGGVAFGALIGIFEFWWDKSQAPYGERDHILVEFLREFKLVLTCTGSRPNPESSENSIADDATSKRSGPSRQMSAASGLSSAIED